MAKNSNHYLENGKLYKGPVHKMNGKIHTGAKHTASSKVVTHSKPGVDMLKNIDKGFRKALKLDKE